MAKEYHRAKGLAAVQKASTSSAQTDFGFEYLAWRYGFWVSRAGAIPVSTSRGRGTGFPGPQAQRPPRGGRELREASDRGGLS